MRVRRALVPAPSCLPLTRRVVCRCSCRQFFQGAVVVRTAGAAFDGLSASAFCSRLPYPRRPPQDELVVLLYITVLRRGKMTYPVAQMFMQSRCALVSECVASPTRQPLHRAHAHPTLPQGRAQAQPDRWYVAPHLPRAILHVVLRGVAIRFGGVGPACCESECVCVCVCRVGF